MAEDGIKHTTLKINGINMHFAEKGEGPVVLFIHGFPELWCSWRRQIHAIAALGYRAVAQDMRGYGNTDAPADAAAYTYGDDYYVCRLQVPGEIEAEIEEAGDPAKLLSKFLAYRNLRDPCSCQKGKVSRTQSFPLDGCRRRSLPTTSTSTNVEALLVD